MFTHKLRRAFFSARLLSYIFLTLISLSTFANSDGDDDDVDFGKMDSIPVDKGEIGQMIKMMKESGQISEEDAAKAQVELNGKSDADMKNLQAEAANRIKSGNIPKLPPAKAEAPAPVEKEVVAQVQPIEVSQKSVVTEPERSPASVVKKDVPQERTKSLQDAFNFINK